MDEDKGFVGKLKVPIVLTVALLLVGSVLYFSLDIEASERMDGESQKMESSGRMDPSFFDSMKVKVAYADMGQVKLFALARNNDMAGLKTIVGEPIPESGQMVIGYDEAQMMMEEDLFSGVGDRIEGLFGISPAVGGILDKTGTILDDLHFVGEKEFDQLDGESDRVFVKVSPEGLPKLFYTYGYGEILPIDLNLKEGSLDYFKGHVIAGESYYPVILGAKEADMMKSEGLFENSGDIIKGFFGKNVVVAGVLAETGSALDMMHLLPLSKESFG